jgi:GAF domain-containing protein
MPLQPLPETRMALSQVGRWTDHDLVEDLARTAHLVEGLVPECVGLSVSLAHEGLTFTMVATSLDVAVLDGVQYAVGGPCVDAVEGDRTIAAGDGSEGLLGEAEWAAFARVSAAHGVQSTLSLPLRRDGRVTGGVNLYASEPDAFAGRHEALAALMGAWAPEVVENADLGFDTRASAKEAPHRLQERFVVDQAAGVVMAERAVDESTARAILADAALRAGESEVRIAEALLRPLTDRHEPRS